MNDQYSTEELNRVFHDIYPDLEEAGITLNNDQITIIRSVISGKDTLNILPTGAGKSACYLVPAMLLPGITIVISPLLSLIQDQVTALYRNKMPVACITGSFLVDRDGVHRFDRKGRELTGKNTVTEGVSSAEAFERMYVTRRIVRDDRIFLDTIMAQNSREGITGDHGYKILYMTPERLRTGQFIRFAERAKISMIAVDEAHCVSLWGYEFRRRYLEISRFLKRIDQRPVMAAFTATATDIVKRDIEKYLSLDTPVQYPPFGAQIQKRTNLNFSVRTLPRTMAPKSEEEYRLRAIRAKCQKLLKQFDEEDKTYCIMIYCLTVDQVRMYYKSFLKCKDLKDQVTLYFADLDSDTSLPGKGTKQRNWEAFLKNRKRIMISTSALGMGVDKGNIRYVIHAGMPMSLENYYQEAGRAGRFRRGYAQMKGDCILYCLRSDEETCADQISRSISESRLKGKQKQLRQKIAYDRLEQIKKYCDVYLKTPLYDPERTLPNKLPQDPQQYIVDYFNFYRPAFFDPDDPEIRTIEDSFQKEIAEIDVLIANRTKIAQMIRKGQMGAADISVGKKGTSHEVSYQITGGTISYLDMMAADAVYTLFKHGQNKIYSRNVAELLSGDHDIMLTTKNTRMINDSLRKMSKIKIRIDMTHSAEMGFFYDDEMDEHHDPITILEGAFLPLEEGKSGFLRIEKRLPPLYQYAEIMNGQFHAFGLSLMKVMLYDSFFDAEGGECLKPVKRMPASWTNMAMTHYLMRRIDSMRRSQTTSVIKLDTMLDVLGEFFDLERFQHSSPYGRKIRDIQEKEKLILTHFMQEQYISGFEQAVRFEKGKKTNEPIPDSIRIIKQ